MRRLMSARMAREVGAWLSATESPWHSGHLSSVSRSWARAAGDCEPLGHSTTANATTTTTPSAIHAPHRRITARSRRLPRCGQEELEILRGHRAVLRRGDGAAGRDRVRLGLPARAEVEGGDRLRVEDDRPVDAVVLDVRLHRVG